MSVLVDSRPAAVESALADRRLPDCSVIVVNWNTCALLRDCLRSLENAAVTMKLECLVVDNGSSDGSQRMVRSEFPWVLLDEAGANLGFARANNRALAAACGRYLLLLNSDTVVQPGALDLLLNVADSLLEAGVLGPRLLNADGTLQESWAAFPSLVDDLIGRQTRTANAITQPLQAQGAPSLFDVDWVGGAALLIRRAVFEAVGGLDEGYFMYSEETDYCYRVRQAGWRVVYVMGADVVHLGGASSTRRSLVQLQRLYDSKLRFAAKHRGLLQALVLRSGLIALQTLRFCQEILPDMLQGARLNGRAGDRLRLITHLAGGYARRS